MEYINAKLFSVFGFENTGDGEDTNSKVLHYISVSVYPNPNETLWPRDLGPSVWCPPEVTISFTHRGHDTSIDLLPNKMLDIDRIPVAEMEADQLVSRIPEKKVSLEIFDRNHHSPSSWISGIASLDFSHKDC